MPLWYGLIFRSTKIPKKKKIVHAQTHTQALCQGDKG